MDEYPRLIRIRLRPHMYMHNTPRTTTHVPSLYVTRNLTEKKNKEKNTRQICLIELHRSSLKQTCFPEFSIQRHWITRHSASRWKNSARFADASLTFPFSWIAGVRSFPTKSLLWFSTTVALPIVLIYSPIENFVNPCRSFRKILLKIDKRIQNSGAI